MADINAITSIVSKCECLDFPVKGRACQAVSEQGPTPHCLQEAHFSFKDKNMLKVKERKIIYYANNNPRRTGEPTLTSYKTDIERNKM